MAGRSFTRHSNGIGNRIRAEHINELQSALEEDDARIDLKADDGQFTAHVDNTDNPHGVTKAQVGLGNVDNTSDMAKPVSTAQQAALDTKADVEDAVPAGGVYGQVLTVTHQGREWVDPPGIVYPSLLLSPNGSFDRNGAVSPLVGTVTEIEGTYGAAWRFAPSNGNVRVPNMGHLTPDRGTIVARVREPVAGGAYPIDINYPNGFLFGVHSTRNHMLLSWAGVNHTVAVVPPINTWSVWAVSWDGARLLAYVDGVRIIDATRPGAAVDFGAYVTFGERASSGRTSDGEAALYYRDALPAAEIARLAAISDRWTMQNTAVNMALQSQPPATPGGASLLSYFPPNRKIATGGTTLRIAPGASTTAITTLAAGTDVHDTKATVSVSSVSYSLVVTAFGNAWVPTSTLV